MKSSLLSGFRRPKAVYRSAPFWSWNEVMTPDRVRHQLDAMKEGGFGGAFLHSRIGLISPYLGTQWKRAVLAAVDHCKKRGMLAYLYDEDRWPSGFAGGIVTRTPSNRMWYLHVTRKGSRLTWEILRSPRGGSRYATWFNGQGYLDTLSPEPVAAFLSSTHEVYRTWCGDEFGRTVPAIFTDEPTYCIGAQADEKRGEWLMPWTKGFAALFGKRYGYDIRSRIADLVEDRPGCESVRYDYHRLTTELFVTNFGKRVFDWCQRAGIALTGHYLEEDSLRRQVALIGDAMAFYEWMHWPGVDHLGRNINNPLTLKQCSSVAHQMGRERVLSELYGCSGQNFTRADMKRIADWHICLGINFFCPHLYLYSLRGARKRDFPPTISHHQPYWKHARDLEDYFARVNFLMAAGQPVADVLVIHPIETAWCLYPSSRLAEYDEALASLTQKLLERQVEYDFGNEGMMERHASVDDGTIRVGRMQYSTVVIPPAVSLRGVTVRLLESFARAGGRILAPAEFPSLVEGRPAAANLEVLARACRRYGSVEELAEVVSHLREVTVCAPDGSPVPEIHLIRRSLEVGAQAVFLANTSAEKELRVRLTLPGKVRVQEADAFTGDVRPLPVTAANGSGTTVDLLFPPVGSHLLLTEPGASQIAKSAPRPAVRTLTVKDWTITPDRDNLLVLDFCRVKTGRRWSKLTYVPDVQNALERAGRRRRIHLMFPFFVDRSFRGGLNIIVEQGSRWRMWINGRRLASRPSGWWLDEVLEVFPVPAECLLRGANRLEMETTFVPPRKKGTLIFTPDGLEVENVFLSGRFSVSVRRTTEGKGGLFHQGFAISSPHELSPGDITRQGYPFYAGGLVCEATVSVDGQSCRRYLSFSPFSAIVAEVSVNGRRAGIVSPPYRIEVTDLLKPGANRIRVVLLSSLRNPFGPHHLDDANPESVGPASFQRTASGFGARKWCDAYATVPFGLGNVTLVEER